MLICCVLQRDNVELSLKAQEASGKADELEQRNADLTAELRAAKTEVRLLLLP